MGAMRKRVVPVVAAALLAGCGAEQLEEVPLEPRSEEVQVSAADTHLNGRSLNGRSLNGRSLNGRSLNGQELDQLLVSVDLAGARLGGAALEGVGLEGSAFRGSLDGRALSGQDFTGVSFTGRLGGGGTVALRVDGMAQGSGVDADIWSYRVSYREPSDGHWYPICLDEQGAAAGAIPVEGRWDYRQGVPGGGAKLAAPGTFTFACEGAAIAKCVRYGYKPWAKAASGESLAAHHQACTRLIRADFCGDGTSYTVNGQWVNLYDVLGVQDDTERWVAEAEWDEGGARCFASRTRSHRPVACAGERQPRVCGSKRAFSEGTLLISELPPSNSRAHIPTNE
jgi:hypothetical protein